MKIFTKMLIFLILGATVPLVASHHFAGLMYSRILRDHVFEDITNSLAEAGKRVEDKMGGTAQALTTVRETVPFEDLSKEELHRALEAPFRQFAGVTVVALLDAEGNAIVPPYFASENEAKTLGRHPVDERDLDRFAQHVPIELALSADVAVGPAYLSQNGKPRVAMATALGLRDGETPWILAIEREMDDICAMVSSYEHTESRSARILDNEGRTVCGPGGQIPSQLVAYQRDHCSYKMKDTGLSSFKWVRDRSVQCDSVHVKGTEWWLIFERTHGELAASMSRQIDWTLAWIAIAMVIVVGGGIIFSKALTRPIAELHKGVTTIADGNYTQPIRVYSTDEVGSLATAFEHMRSEIQRWNRELVTRVDKRTGDLKEAREQVLRTQKLAAVGELGSGVAHEINNPLTSAIGTAQVLLDGLEPESEMANGLQDIVDSCNRVAAVVEALLRFSQTQAKPGMQPVDISYVVYDWCVINVMRLEKREILCGTEIDETCRVIGHENDLRLALSHVFDNAIRAMEQEGGTLMITVHTIEGGAVGITISDTGTGMSEEVRLRAFDPFYSTRPSATDSSGIGLAMAHRVVTDHNGRIVIDSAPDKGTTVSIYLPGAAQLSRT